MSTHEEDFREIGSPPNIHDDQAHRACYIFRPAKHESVDVDDRPQKKRKTSRSLVERETPLFPRLYGGLETTSSSSLRSDAFDEIWSRQQRKIDEIVHGVYEEALRGIIRFGKDALHSGEEALPTGLVLAGPQGNIQARLLDQWKEWHNTAGSERVIQLESSQAPNLQTALKAVIKAVIIQTAGADGYQDFLAEHKRLIPMNFDLELLQIYALERGIAKVVVSILDVETFDVGILSDLICTLSSWSDRVPFVLLLGLATTVELFEARLPKSTVRLLDAQVFDLTTSRDVNYEIFRATQADPEAKVYLGPIVCGILEEMSKDQGITSETFAASIRYAYMSHFFANPLSLLVAHQTLGEAETRCLYEAIRNSESFQRHAENLLLKGKAGAQELQKLLKSGDHLLKVACSAIEEGQQKITEFYEAIDAFKELPNLLMLQPPANSSAFDVDLEALSGRDFINSDPYISIMGIIEKIRSNHLLAILRSSVLTSNAVNTHGNETNSSIFDAVLGNLEAFQQQHHSANIRSAYDPSIPQTATTLTKSHTIGLTKQAPQLTVPEQQYTEIMDNLLASLESYFDGHITKSHYKNLFMHEAFVYDLKVPLNMVFTPRPRYAIERALERPGDYLGCECCTDGSGDRSKHDKMPPASILWRLWCEAGAFVNVRDLWEAFRGILMNDHTREIADSEDGADFVNDPAPSPTEIDLDGEGGDQRHKMTDRLALALFYRSLAELKMLGFVKASKRKPGVECLAKTIWRGL